MAQYNPKVTLQKAPVVERAKWDPDDHPHAIWCSSYGPDEAMQSTNTLSYRDPKEQADRFDLTLAGSEESPTQAEEVPSEIASIGQAGCAHKKHPHARTHLTHARTEEHPHARMDRDTGQNAAPDNDACLRAAIAMLCTALTNVVVHVLQSIARTTNQLRRCCPDGERNRAAFTPRRGTFDLVRSHARRLLWWEGVVSVVVAWLYSHQAVRKRHLCVAVCQLNDEKWTEMKS